jgi:hypothetical protein
MAETAREELARRVGAFLAGHHVMSLASLGADGPHAANLFYACDGLALLWVSDADTRHSREIAADPRVAVTVAPDYADFADIRGLQIAGLARRLGAEDERAKDQRNKGLALMEARYPFLKQLAEGPAKLREAYARTAVYRLEPARMVLIDNSKGFGHKEVLDFPA